MAQQADASPKSVSDCARWMLNTLGDGVDSQLLLPLLLERDLYPGRFPAVLADGRLLELLLRRLRGTGGQPGVPANEANGGGAEQRVLQFLRACTDEFEVPADCLFQPADLTAGQAAKAAERVVSCLFALSQSNAAAAAGLPALGSEVDSIYGDHNCGQFVLSALDQIVSFFRAIGVVARELRESPLSLWPPESVGALFGPSVRLLELLVKLRSDLRSGQPLDEALAEREPQLLQLYADNIRCMYLAGWFALRGLTKECHAQVTLALSKQPLLPDSNPKCIEDIQLLSMRHVNRLLSSAKTQLGRSGSEAKEVLERSQEILERSQEILQRMESLLTKYNSSLTKKLQDSCLEFAALRWSSPQWSSPDALGRLRFKGILAGSDSKRISAVLWDRALVLSALGSGDVLEVIDIAPDLKFEKLPVAKSVLQNRKCGFRVFESEAKSPAPRQRLFYCDPNEDEKWLGALNKAVQASFPTGCDSHGHSFRLVQVLPEDLGQECRRCGRTFSCWAHRCDRCRALLHTKCVVAECGSGGDHIRCAPVPRPRRLPAGSQPPQPQEQQPEEAQPGWVLSDPLDAGAAGVRLRELRRGRNFVLCPKAAAVARAASVGAADQRGFQLHVLSGGNVVTYDVEADAPGGGRRVRISGCEEAFGRLSDLVQHYVTHSLPPPITDEEEQVYSCPAEKLTLDSGVMDC